MNEMEIAESTKNKTKGLKIALGISMLLIGFMGYFLYDTANLNQRQSDTIAQKDDELAITMARLDSVSNQLDLKIEEVAQLGGQVEDLKKAKSHVLSQKEVIRRDPAFSRQKYEEQIAEYISLLEEKDNLIAQLKSENADLSGKTQAMTQEVLTLSQEKEGMSQQVNGLKEEISTVKAKNNVLTSKIVTGAQLKADNLQIYALKENGKESTGGVYKAKRVSQIKISFALPTNPLTEQNSKEIYVRIIDPEGAIIADNVNVSGVFNQDGKDIAYTTKTSIIYSNDNQKVDILYARGQVYESGLYAVELFSEGFKIGRGSFIIK